VLKKKEERSFALGSLAQGDRGTQEGRREGGACRWGTGEIEWRDTWNKTDRELEE